MYNILCLNNISHYGTDLLTDSYALTDDASKATGILVRSADMHSMEFSENLLAIARAGAGVNNIPLDECAKQGIVVFNTPGANANAVKELTLCSLFLASRDIIGGVEWIKENAQSETIGKDAEKAKKAFAGKEIIGKKLGVIGLGAIGALVANAAVDLGMDVYGVDPYMSVDGAWQLSSRIHHVTNYDEIYKNCDFLTIHVPAMPATVGMVDAHACSIMKPGCVFLNFSRDTLVDTEAMAKALEEGRVAKYITDFATPEVMKMKNVLVFPHLGASTAEAEDNCAIMATRQIMDYIENGNIVNSVNFPNCTMGPKSQEGTRIAVMHANVPNMIGQISKIFGDAGENIANLTNKARGDYAYTLIDLDNLASEEAIAALNAISDIIRVRVL
ncbi:MAG: 3-phosphoglycerate dehydrogenase [Eggerthellaceae bacterium]|nr:3-phosphoglycerate dehydrogenase [Eggerthellaceae bacterium]